MFQTHIGKTYKICYILVRNVSMKYIPKCFKVWKSLLMSQNLQKLCIVNIDDASANEDWDRQTMCCSVCAECLLVAMMAFVLFT